MKDQKNENCICTYRGIKNTGLTQFFKHYQNAPKLQILILQSINLEIISRECAKFPTPSGKTVWIWVQGQYTVKWICNCNLYTWLKRRTIIRLNLKLNFWPPKHSNKNEEMWTTAGVSQALPAGEEMSQLRRVCSEVFVNVILPLSESLDLLRTLILNSNCPQPQHSQKSTCP